MSNSLTAHARVPSSRARRSAVTATLAALTLLTGAGAGVVAAAPAGADSRTAARRDIAQQQIEQLVRVDGFPGALASLRDADGWVRNYTAGVGDIRTGAPVPTDGHVRIASASKMFTAVVVLQLADEGRLDLDAPIETYVPNLVRGDGVDGRKMTTRQLLNHTSGLPNYTAHMPPFDQIRHRYHEPRELLDIALAQKPTFPPGGGWEYSNTGYIVAGLIVQKITGRPISEEVTNRVIKRIGLRHTYWPGVGDQGIRNPHPHGYALGEGGEPPTDITEMDPSWGGAAGQLIARPSDLNRFLAALMGGRLLSPEMLDQMRTTVEAPQLPSGWRYGLGLISQPLTCGGTAWGHGGDIDGYETRDAVTTDGRAATVVVTALPTSMDSALRVNAALDAVLCAGR